MCIFSIYFFFYFGYIWDQKAKNHEYLSCPFKYSVIVQKTILNLSDTVCYPAGSRHQKMSVLVIKGWTLSESGMLWDFNKVWVERPLHRHHQPELVIRHRMELHVVYIRSWPFIKIDQTLLFQSLPARFSLQEYHRPVFCYYSPSGLRFDMLWSSAYLD